MAKENHDNLIFKFALLGAGYFLIVKPILEKAHLVKDPEVLATEAKAKELIQAQVDAALKTDKPTKTPTQWKIVADNIWKLLQSSFFEKSRTAAMMEMCRVQNNADYWLLFKYFAQRQDGTLSIIPGVSKLYNLEQFVKNNLWKKELAVIFRNYRNKGITNFY